MSKAATKSGRFTATGDVSRSGGQLRYVGDARLVKDRTVCFTIAGPVHYKYNQSQGSSSPARRSPRPAKGNEQRRVLIADPVQPGVNAPRAMSVPRHTPPPDPIVQHTPSVVDRPPRRAPSPVRQRLSTRLRLLLPVAMVKRRLKEEQNGALRMSDEAAVRASAVLEYLCGEMVECGRVAATFGGQQRRVTSDYLRVAVSDDNELHRLLDDVIFPRDQMRTH